MANETDPILKVKGEVFQRFPNTSNGGTYNCRKIRRSDSWSQHAWGNALDIMVPDLSTGDRVMAWLVANRGRHGTGTILWRVKDHFDHVHVEGMPKQRGTPPCAGGTPRQGDPSPGGGSQEEKGHWEFNPITGQNEWVGPIEDIFGEGAAGGITDAITAVPEFLGLLTKAETWIRVGLLIGGAGLLAGGLIVIGKELAQPILQEVGSVVGSLPGAGKLASAVVK